MSDSESPESSSREIRNAKIANARLSMKSLILFFVL